jgi:hypothetical protein
VRRVTHHESSISPSADPVAEISQLARVLGLVAGLAGRPPLGDEMLDEAARIGAAHADALPIDRRRFDRVAAETTARAEAGLEALIALQESRRPTRAAAARLAEAIEEGLVRLSGIVAG